MAELHTIVKKYEQDTINWNTIAEVKCFSVNECQTASFKRCENSISSEGMVLGKIAKNSWFSL